ncbi:AzlD domain-containing protein [Agrococcus carbonis]|uniref:Branched-chain amino acid transport protein (AzlD) n=1 Tax=Agrococcus carbonis TaxID=684552 RepID=A0A1H1SV37_9MICO|nr:AzlD domain-containing protein [Agrococcus carbonis]SDS51728.1 Branched-chain amino acid transport protein (AzlD) [Agrococcus carbonis]
MTLWHLLLLASIAVLAIKLVGYAVPPRLFERPRPRRTLELLTVSLLAGLVAVQTLGGDGGLVLDARIPAVLVAAGLFAVRAPFIVAVAAAAAVAAALRQWAGFA